MAVIYYQLFIIATLIATRIFMPKGLLAAALIWTVLTLINLFFPPLIVIQLAVVWGAFALLRPRASPPVTSGAAAGVKQAVSATVQASEAPASSETPPKGHVRLRMTDAVLLPRDLQPSWVNSEKLGQFKAGAMENGMDVHSLPLTFVLERINEPETMQRLLCEAAYGEIAGCSFEEQMAQAARSLAGMWRNASNEERSARLESDARLERIKF